MLRLTALVCAALAHHYEACSIDVAADKTSLSTKKSQATSHGGTANESFIGNAREALRAAAAAFEESEEDAASATALKRAHLKEALASHEETQRLQRMCRFLKVSLSRHIYKHMYIHIWLVCSYVCRCIYVCILIAV